MTEEFCDRCKDIDDDRRSLLMACFYDMAELGLPFQTESIAIEGQNTRETLYKLRVCKTCRAQWMAAIVNWFFDPCPNNPSCGSGIFIRELGAVREITEDEWYQRNPNREPIRLKS